MSPPANFLRQVPFTSQFTGEETEAQSPAGGGGVSGWAEMGIRAGWGLGPRPYGAPLPLGTFDTLSLNLTTRWCELGKAKRTAKAEPK